MKKKIELRVQLGQHEVDFVENMPMEDIYAIMDGFDNNFRNFEKIGSGSFGHVFGYKDYAIKRFKDEDNDMNRDVNVLKEIGHLDCIPTLYAVIDDHVMIMERIEGRTVRDYCNYGNYDNNICNVNKDFIEMFDNALIEVIKHGYSPEDMHESNVMIDFKTKTPKLVDVGFFVKHNQNYNNFDIHTIKDSDGGYSRANMWTGYALKNYVEREERRLQREAKKVLDKYNLANVAV